jgi:hypothetical protein
LTECFQRGAQLVALRAVLGVVDDGEISPSEGKSDIEGLRLRRRANRGDGNDHDGDAVFAPSDCRAGGVVSCLDCDDDVEFFPRVVQPLDR